MDILALDFDGVICDSAGETGASGWRAARRLWPDRFQGDAPTEIVEAFCSVRPVLETGFESILLVSMLMEGTGVARIRANYHDLRDKMMRDISFDAEQLIDAFGRARDEWMRDDLNSWLAAHRFYRGVVDAVNKSTLPSYIITTKERRFAVALIRHIGLAVGEEQVYGLESGPKLDVLTKISRRHPQAAIHFVEDRLKTLLKVQPEAGNWLYLYFASWGYVTDAEREIAESAAEITTLEESWFGEFAQTPASFVAKNGD